MQLTEVQCDVDASINVTSWRSKRVANSTLEPMSNVCKAVNENRDELIIKSVEKDSQRWAFGSKRMIKKSS